MKKIIWLLCIFQVSILFAIEFAPNEIIVKTRYRMDVTENSFGRNDIDEVLQSEGDFSIKQINSAEQQFLLSFDDISVENTVANLRRFPDFEYVQPNYLRKFYVTPNDPQFPLQQHDLVKLQQAWNSSTGSENILIAVVDSGIYLNHPDLKNNLFVNRDEIDFADFSGETNLSFADLLHHFEYENLDLDNNGTIDQYDIIHEDSPLINGVDDDENGYVDDIFGWDFTDAPSMSDQAVGDYLIRDNNPTDESSHGTHVAGIIGASTNNGIGISGVTWQTNILPIRAGLRTTSGGFLQDDDIAAAIIYSTNMGSKIINASWGDTENSPIISDAIQYAFERDVIVVCSAGNTGNPGVMYPAKSTNTIAVGSVSSLKTKSTFSTFGNELDIMAPGEFIISTIFDEEMTYGEKSGTSMAAPYVTGIIGLLLAKDPTLSFREVKSLIAETAEDIGADGYDVQTGFGLIDAYALLGEESSVVLEISSPLDYSGVSGSVEIFGTVKSNQFSRYTVLYTDVENPTTSDWYDVYSPHNNTPTFFFEQKENEKLADFEISPYFAEGDYTLMLKMYLTDGSILRANSHLTVDRTPPILKDMSFQNRYESTSSQKMLKAIFDDKVTANVTIIDAAQNEIEISSNQPDSIHFFAFPDEVSVGSFDVEINATNQAFLELEPIQLLDFAEVENNYTSIGKYLMNPSGNAITFTDKFVDEENNFLGFEDSEIVYSPIKKYRLLNSQVYENGIIYDNYGQTIEEFPIDIGNTNSDATEFLTTKFLTASLWEEQSEENVFQKIFSIPECYGAVLEDITGNSIDDVVACEDMNVVSGGTERVLKIYSRIGSDFYLQNTLFNTTATNLKNTFYPIIKVADLDGDNYNDVLASDQDGDVLIYEIYPGNQDSLIWSQRLPIDAASLIEFGDFTGDGTNEICVGGYATNDLMDNEQFWYLSFWDSISDNEFTLMQEMFFGNVQNISRNNSINAGNVDNEFGDELVCSFSPYSYIIKYDNNEFVPIWTGISGFSYRTLIKETEAENDSKIIMNSHSGDDSQLIVVTPNSGNYIEPPQNVKALPLDASRIEISWNEAENADYYKIFRKKEDEEIELLAELSDTNFVDTDVIAGVVYSYAVLLVDEDSSPSESALSYWSEAVASEIPSLESVQMSAQNRLTVNYNLPLHSEVQDENLFTVNNEIGSPNSVILINENKTILLTFSNNFSPSSEENYILMIKKLSGANGIEIQAEDVEFAYVEDTTPPLLLASTVTDENVVELEFDEAVDMSSALDTNNYVIEVPQSINQNSISIINQLSEKSIELVLNEKLVHSNQKYLLFAENISDLSGNKNPKLQTAFSLTEITNLNFIETYPNPLRIGEMREIRFINLPTDKVGKIWIYNISGELVFTEKFGPLNEQPEKYFAWKAVNNRFKKVSSGTYFYVLKMEGEIKKGTLVLIR